jgi:dTDP-glucose pyrophosphorylase
LLINNIQYLILAAGKINYLSLPVNTNSSNSMIPVNGKPVIAWILEDLIKKNAEVVYIVTRNDDVHLNQFLKRTYSNKLNLKIVEVTKTDSILDSLKFGLKHVNPQNPINILLGDTLITDSLPNESDYILVQEVTESSRWCLTTFDAQQHIERFIEKEPNLHGTIFAACGFYSIQNTKLLVEQTEIAQQFGERQLSDVLNRYKSLQPLKVIFAKRWYDFGNIDNFIKAKQELLQSRYFNTLTIDPLLNTITKVSEFNEKLRNELNWYEYLPERLRVLTPRIVSKDEHDKRLYLVQEYYGYPNLSELYLYSDLNSQSWYSIIKKLLLLHSELGKYKGELNKEEYFSVYYLKTKDRLSDLVNDVLWKNILEFKTIYINGEAYDNITSLEAQIERMCRAISHSGQCTIIHGDFCLSNILFDINSQITKLIDPRGSFGKKGIYGDPRYDIAKLRHSFVGNYDFIVSDLFEVENINNNFNYEIYTHENVKEIAVLFDEMIISSGYKLTEIKFIEALLFISMLPLHKDKPNRQKVMYLQGIKLLNEIVNENSN